MANTSRLERSAFISDEVVDVPMETGSAVSWAAIFSGAVAAAATSLILVALGSGLGLAFISPWPYAGASVAAFSVMTGIWLIVIQWAAAGIGGYMTGRLRTKWVGTHTHEVFFRDTAHGFVAWALSTVMVALLFTLGASAVVGGGVRAAATVASGAAQGAAISAQPSTATGRAYDVDSLFRMNEPNSNASPADVRAETTRILASGISNGDVSAADRTYLAQLVAARAGVPQADAQKRVDDVIAREKDAEMKAREAADTARKATSAASFFLALSLLIGAFIGSAAAALGGRLRDENGVPAL